MIYKPMSAAWKSLSTGFKGALSGTSFTKAEKFKLAATGTLGLLGTTSIIKNTSKAKQRQDNLRNKSRSTFRGF